VTFHGHEVSELFPEPSHGEMNSDVHGGEVLRDVLLGGLEDKRLVLASDHDQTTLLSRNSSG
jgi:hypothetical protein